MKRKLLTAFTFACCIACVALIITAYFLELALWQDMLFQGVEEFLLGTAAVLIIIMAERKYYLRPRLGGILGLFVILGGLAVAAANFPFATLYSGEMELGEFTFLPVYIFYVFAIGFFEEMAFRGVLFNEVLSRTKQSRLGLFIAIMITNVVFALVHLLNLLSGAGFGATLLQVSYTFLIGCMCNIIMLFTGCLYWAVLVHAVFDFGGLLISSGMATGAPWNIPGAVIMAAVGVVVTLFYIIIFIKNRHIVLKAYNR